MTVRLEGPPAGAQGRADLDLALLRRRAKRMLSALGHARSELSIALVDDVAIAELNAAYRNKPGPTDVLSFSLVEGEHDRFRGQLLGDVVVSVETALVQARERHRSLDERIARLVVHGLLHLVGHDHEQDAEARVMQREERRLWRALEPSE